MTLSRPDLLRIAVPGARSRDGSWAARFGRIVELEVAFFDSAYDG